MPRRERFVRPQPRTPAPAHARAQPQNQLMPWWKMLACDVYGYYRGGCCPCGTFHLMPVLSYSHFPTLAESYPRHTDSNRIECIDSATMR